MALRELKVCLLGVSWKERGGQARLLFFSFVSGWFKKFVLDFAGAFLGRRTGLVFFALSMELG